MAWRLVNDVAGEQTYRLTFPWHWELFEKGDSARDAPSHAVPAYGDFIPSPTDLYIEQQCLLAIPKMN